MVDQVAPHVVMTGQTLVAVPGTQVVLGLATDIRTVVVRAHATNAGNIYVGPAAVAAGDGYILAAGESIAIAIDSRGTVWIDADNGGEGVSYLCVI